ncbi:hypothetical protein B0T13DRAFT_450201 [Neurospora crassa]|nr:hypothetical protein B0T13DRAFT_450201 [Neurospora crassa]
MIGDTASESNLTVSASSINVFGTVAEPDKESQPGVYETGFIQRAITLKIVLSTLKNMDVITMFTCNGWDRRNRNPKVLYDLVQSYCHSSEAALEKKSCLFGSSPPLNAVLSSCAWLDELPADRPLANGMEHA